MSFYNGTELQDAYSVYGVAKEKGAMVVVRPDGYVGCLGELGEDGLARVERYLRACLRTVGEAKGHGATNGHN